MNYNSGLTTINATLEPKGSKRHLIISLLLFGIILTVGPYGLPLLELSTSPKQNSWLILLIIFFGTTLKSAINFAVNKDFRYDKWALEINSLAMSGFLTCLSLQITHENDMFPGVESITFLSFLHTIEVTLVVQHIILISLLFGASIFGVIWASVVISETEKKQRSYISIFISCMIGLLFLACYATLLIYK
jgi:hypothetical protein